MRLRRIPRRTPRTRPDRPDRRAGQRPSHRAGQRPGVADRALAAALRSRRARRGDPVGSPRFERRAVVA